MSSVLIVGSVALDTVETPMGLREEMLGGSATYFSMAASHFSPVRLVAVVGDDFPDELRRLFESRAVDIEGLQVSPGRTFRWSGAYHGMMNEAVTRETQLNVFEGFRPMLPDRYRDTPFVFLGNIDPVLQADVMTQIRAPELVALDTMNFWIDGARNRLEDVLARIDLLIINEGELQLLSGKSNVAAGIRDVMQMGPRSVIIKRGGYGSVLYHDSDWFFVPGYPEERVVDPTGAGDSFAGGFMGSLARDGEVTARTLRRAMIYGSVVASFNITDFGPWKLADLSAGDIEQRFNDFRRLVSI
ncbi:sugar kinase [bacterium]|nr:sugar kinase [candidate division CSSED10-310 bacterium]